MEPDPTERNALGLLDRALLLLTLVATAESPLSLNDVVEQAGLPRTTCHRLLKTLLKWGLVEKTGQHRYVLGAWILELSGQYLEGSNARQHYRPLLALARDLSGEAACLVVKRGSSRICIDFVASKQPIAYNPKLGETLPISVGASGRAFLSDIEPVEERRRALVSLYEDVDENSVRHIIERAEEERIQGYFVSHLDRPGMNGVAIPLKNADRRIVATISVVGPSTRWTPDRIHEIAPKLLRSIQTYRGADRNLFEDP